MTKKSCKYSKCFNCGRRVPKGYDFCDECNRKLGEIMDGDHPGVTEWFMATAMPIIFGGGRHE